MRRITWVLVPLLAWALWAGLTLPPAARVLQAPPGTAMPTARGAYHIHSRASDGTGTLDDIARAAAAAGLQFVIVTDHGDATARTGGPQYRAGVLCIEGVEISTAQGHYAAIGISRPPYPLAGEGRDVAEDVARLGGFGIAAHPDSARASLQWRDWEAAVDGIEWFNADSQWRDEARWRLLPSLLQYLVRPAETIASLFDRPVEGLASWDRMAAHRRVVGLAAADAHARLGLEGDADPYQGSLHVSAPSYEAMFRAFSLHAELAAPLSGDAGADAPLVLDAIRQGRIAVAFDAIARPAAIDFAARSGGLQARQGGWLAGVDARFDARVNVPPGGSLVLLRDGQPVAEAAGPALTYRADRGGAYRLEARVPGAPGVPPLPWAVTNPIYVGPRYAPHAPAGDGATAATPDAPWLPGEWHVEHDPASTGAVETAATPDGPSRAFTFQLAPSAASPFAALVTDEVGGVRGASRVAFRARASRPLRLSVQARCDDGGAVARRWVRSIYLDGTPREVTVAFADMRIAGTGERTPIEPGRITSILFVYDTVNARPGDGGRVWIDRLRTGR